MRITEQITRSPRRAVRYQAHTRAAEMIGNCVCWLGVRRIRLPSTQSGVGGAAGGSAGAAMDVCRHPLLHGTPARRARCGAWCLCYIPLGTKATAPTPADSAAGQRIVINSYARRLRRGGASRRAGFLRGNDRAPGPARAARRRSGPRALAAPGRPDESAREPGAPRVQAGNVRRALAPRGAVRARGVGAGGRWRPPGRGGRAAAGRRRQAQRSRLVRRRAAQPAARLADMSGRGGRGRSAGRRPRPQRARSRRARVAAARAAGPRRQRRRCVRRAGRVPGRRGRPQGGRSGGAAGGGAGGHAAAAASPGCGPAWEPCPKHGSLPACDCLRRSGPEPFARLCTS